MRARTGEPAERSEGRACTPAVSEGIVCDTAISRELFSFLRPNRGPGCLPARAETLSCARQSSKGRQKENLPPATINRLFYRVLMINPNIIIGTLQKM